MSLMDYLRLISSVLGIIAIGCVLAVGSCIIAWCWNMYSAGLGADFLILTLMSWVFIFVSALLLVYGSLNIMKKSALKGGLTNLIAGVEMIPIFWYFYVCLPFLPQFAFLGFLLFLPALLSAIVSLVSLRASKS